uniref:Cytochrome c biogenesis protein CcsA n=1 Tax=Helminthocladia australis TaxID=260093 RepID=A0A1G4NTD6_9FLOR|nr:Cytochrome c biogenesis protein ccs1 [Helminthocladia australis]SCW21920.1 Cytochrome c biogenesis protein ccs1 [Helminthocladia australis]
MNWNMVHNTLINTSFLLLLINLITVWTTIAFPKFIWLKVFNKWQVIAVNVLLSIALGSRWLIHGYFPLSNLYESLIFLTWCLTFTQILINKQIKSQLVGAISVPIEVFIVAFASLSLPQEMQKASPLVPALHSNWLIMHVTVMILSYAFLLIGSLLSILFLLITRGQAVKLQGSSTGYIIDNSQISNAPWSSSYNNQVEISKQQLSQKPYSKINLLESLDNLSYRTIGLGFPLLTIGIISGAVWANEAWGSYWSWDPKETWALITWLIFASYLHSRLTKSWQGKKPAILASLGFFIVWICYLGVNFLGQGLHSYGWVS